jgi:hypothetical protein
MNRESAPTLIIALSGKIGSGKTTFGSFLMNELEKRGYHVKFKNFADKLKQICKDLTGYGGYTQEEKNIYLEEWGMTVGQCLQKIGTEAMRENFHMQVWVISALSNLSKSTVYIIGDCRFENEAVAVKQKGGIVIRLDGDPGKVRERSQRDINHISETALDNYEGFDERFINEGPISDLKEFVNLIIEKYVEKNFNSTLNTSIFEKEKI